VVQLLAGFLGLLLDLVKELEEGTGVCLQHVLSAVKTVLLKFGQLVQPFDFLLLGHKHLLHLSHFPLLFDELVSVLTVFGSLNGHSVASRLGHVDF